MRRALTEAVARALEIERTEQVPARWTEGALLYRAGRPDFAYYSRQAGGSAACAAPSEAAWHAVASVGGRSGWPAYGWLWRVRAFLDRMVGGIGFRRGRRHPSEVRVGDTIDWWRVVAVEPGRRLTLLAEMRVPGAAVLELEVRPDVGGATSTIVATAYFHPAGVWGLLYWLSLKPIHARIFKRLAVRLAERAEVVAGQGSES